MNFDINYLSVLLAGVASMAVGFLWYSPFLLGKPWMKEMGMTEESIKKNQKNMMALYILSFIASLVTAFVLLNIIALSVNFLNSTKLSAGLTIAFWMWLGFIAPVQLTEVIFGGKSWKLFAINTGYQLAAILAMAVVLAII